MSIISDVPTTETTETNKNVLGLFTTVFAHRHGAEVYTYQSFRKEMNDRYGIIVFDDGIKEILSLVDELHDWRVIHDSDKDFRIRYIGKGGNE